MIIALISISLLVALEDLVAIPPQPVKLLGLVAAERQPSRLGLELLLALTPSRDVDAGVYLLRVPAHVLGLQGEAKKCGISFLFIYSANTNLFRRDDKSLLQQSLADQEQLLVELSNPEAVAVDAGELEELQYDAVEERIADGQG